MAKQMILSLPTRLKEVNYIIGTCSDGTMLFEQANVIARFYYDFQETNLLIAEAETMASESDGRLKEIDVSLKKETDNFLNNIVCNDSQFEDCLYSFDKKKKKVIFVFNTRILQCIYISQTRNSKS